MISLHLDLLIPLPLQERLSQRQSGVWQQKLCWETPQRIFVKAPSGAGKTTLIHLLYGLRHDASGSVLWDGKLLSQMSPEALSKLRRNELSIVFQDLRLFPKLTAWENLEMKRTLTEFYPKEAVQGMMEQLGVADCAGLQAGNLSYGEQQRVSIIRALLQPFHWLLLDEPFSHLDEANKLQAAALIHSVATQHQASVFMVELDENEYFPYSERLEL